jgi:hypothetical protein
LLQKGGCGQVNVCSGLLVSCGEGEAVQGGDGLHGMVEAGSFLAAVAEDLPGLHACEGVLDAGPDLSVRGVR